MSGLCAGLQSVALSVVVAMAAAVTEVRAQGLVNMQKLSAPLANEVVGETVAICAQKG